MRDFSCWYNGNFFYTPLWFEVDSFRKQVEYMNDEDLVDEVLELVYFDLPDVNRITEQYLDTGKLSCEEREYLINFYVLFSCEDYLVISEDR